MMRRITILDHLVRWFSSLTSSRYRGVFIVCLVTLGTSVGVVGATLLARWQVDRAARVDAKSVLDQAAQQLTEALRTRRAMVALLRDTVDKAPELAEPERIALAKGAMKHAPDVVGSGVLRVRDTFEWWVPPAPAEAPALAPLLQEITRRTRLRNFLRLPSMITVFAWPERPMVVLLEPLRARAAGATAVVAVLDAHALLAEVFARTLPPPAVVRVVDGDRVLYRSRRWSLAPGGPPKTIVERPVALAGIRWGLQMQTGAPRMVPRSWLNLLVVIIVALAGLATLGMVWTAERLRQLATTDELTGLFNRRLFLERWETECERAKRYGRHLSCLMVDVNGFKRVNDLLGHHRGDRVLQDVARTLKANLRRTDLLARFGGDEFIVALPETDRSQAVLVAEKLRGLSIRSPWADPSLDHIRVSIGVSQWQPDESPAQAIQRADADLYASRQPSASS